MFADLDPFGCAGQLLPVDRDVFERHVANIVLGVCSHDLHEILAAVAFDRDVAEPDVADESGDLLSHVLVHHRAQTNELPLAFAVHPNVFHRDVLQPHVLARLEQERRHGEVGDVEIPQRDVAHEGGTALVPEQEDAGAVAPEDRIFHGDPLHVAVRSLEIETLQRDAVVVAPDEAVGNQHILGVARVDAVVVLDAGVAQLDVSDRHVPAALGDDGPVRGAAQRDVANLDVAAVANRDQIAHRALAPLPIGAVEDTATADPNVRSLHQHFRLYDRPAGQTLYLAGERLDPDTYYWATDKLGVPVVDNWWQTETGWPIAANCRSLEALPIKAGSPSVCVPGYQVQILDAMGDQLPAGQEGAICIKLPLPPGTFPTLYNDDERFVSSYLTAHPGSYVTGDGGSFDEDGYVYQHLTRQGDAYNTFAGEVLQALWSIEEYLGRDAADDVEAGVVGESE